MSKKGLIMLSPKSNTIENQNCLHCKKIFYNNLSKFCCNGCESVYNFIHLNNFDNYYNLIKNLGKSPASQADASHDYLNIFSSKNLNSIFKLNNNTYGFYIPEVKCAACLWLIEKIARQYPSIDAININLITKIVSFTIETQTEMIQDLARAFTKAGYIPYPPPFSSLKEFRSKEEKERLKDIAVSGFASGNIMLLALSTYFGQYFGIDLSIKKSFSFISMIIAVPATLYGGRSFFKNSLTAILNRQLHMDIPITFALLISLLVSVYKTFINSQIIYYDTLTGLIFLLLVGRYINEKYLSKAKELGENAKELIPKESFNIKENDIVSIPIGKIIPVDGTIIFGQTEVNEASLTGEEIPIYKKENDFVFAGSQNLLKPIKIKAEKTGNDTWVASLNKLIENARNQKSKIETKMQKILPFFVFSVIFASLLSIPVWYFLNPEKILDVFVSILVVSCPCALALATPLTISQTLKKLWNSGIIVKSSDALEALATIDTVVFDKTGTLTNSNLKVISYKLLTPVSENLKHDICIKATKAFGYVCKNSLHHVANSISREFFDNQTKFDFNRIEEIPGSGIIAKSTQDNLIVKIGNYEFINKDETLNITNTDEFCVYGKYNKYIFVFFLSEIINHGAHDLVTYFKKHNIKTYIFSGDKRNSVEKIGNNLGIPNENIYSSCKPETKYKLLEDLQNNKKNVLVLGDGVNDAAMLAKANVSIAMHGGVDIALHSADIFLQSKDLNLIKKTILFSQYAIKTISILIIANIIYNLSVITLAFCGFVNPLFAAISMPISSLCVFLIVYFRRGEKFWT